MRDLPLPDVRRIRPDDGPARDLARLLDHGIKAGRITPGGSTCGPIIPSSSRRSCRTRSPTSSWPTCSLSSRSRAGPTRAWPCSPSPCRAAQPRRRPDRAAQGRTRLQAQRADGDRLPSAEAWSLYYAQSVSLTQFLVEQGTPEQFVSVRPAEPSRKGSSSPSARSTRSPASPSWRTAGSLRPPPGGEITASSREAGSTPSLPGDSEPSCGEWQK